MHHRSATVAIEVENGLAHLRGDIERLAREAKELTEAREDLVQKNQDMLNEIATVEQENIQLRSEIEGIKETLNLKRQSSEEINQKLGRLNEELDSRKTQLMNLMTQEAHLPGIRVGSCRDLFFASGRCRSLRQFTVCGWDMVSVQAYVKSHKVCSQPLREVD